MKGVGVFPYKALRCPLLPVHMTAEQTGYQSPWGNRFDSGLTLANLDGRPNAE